MRNGAMEYQPDNSSTERKRIRSTYYNKRHREENGDYQVNFENSNDYINWYIETDKKQEGHCFYCGVKQSDITQLIEHEI